MHKKEVLKYFKKYAIGALVTNVKKFKNSFKKYAVGGASAAKYCEVGNGPFVIYFYVGGPASDSRRHFLPSKLSFYQMFCNSEIKLILFTSFRCISSIFTLQVISRGC